MARALPALSSLAPAALVLAVGLWCCGAGPINGDAAVYAHQAAAGDLTQRWVHLGWVGLGALLAPLAGASLPWMLDLSVLVAACGATALISLRSGVAAGWCAAAVVLPLASFAEVDLPWAALLLGARFAEPRVAVALAAAAVAISPTALLGVPWVTAERRDGAAAMGAVVAVIGLTALSAGAWWWGDRGVLRAPSVDPWRSLLVWGRYPWWLVLAAVPLHPRLAWLMPLLLAPADVPAWLFAGLAASSSVRVAPLVWRVGVVAAALLSLGVVHRRVGLDAAHVQSAVRTLAPGDGVVAPWTWGVRVSIAATGDPYALPWRPPVGFVRDQARRWCTDPPARALRVTDTGTAWLPAAPVADCPTTEAADRGGP